MNALKLAPVIFKTVKLILKSGHRLWLSKPDGLEVIEHGGRYYRFTQINKEKIAEYTEFEMF